MSGGKLDEHGWLLVFGRLFVRAAADAELAWGLWLMVGRPWEHGRLRVRASALGLLPPSAPLPCLEGWLLMGCAAPSEVPVCPTGRGTLHEARRARTEAVLEA